MDKRRFGVILPPKFWVRWKTGNSGGRLWKEGEFVLTGEVPLDGRGADRYAGLSSNEARVRLVDVLFRL